jgi:hydrogenase expression/formation protein HypD
MEVCGTHTMNIARSGLKSILADYVELRSGPGCPVCVTDQTDIDKIIALAGTPEVVLATFGDMIRVPGTNSSLEQERARNALVNVFYSPEEAVDFAAGHPKKEVVFLGVGFETTAPAIALSIAAAKNKGLKNYSVFSVHKLVPPVMKVLLNDHELRIDGFILPGHVSAITGRKAFDFIASEYNIPAVITGFETVDIIESVYLLLKQILDGKAQTINGYTRLVREEGNIKARELTAEFFEPSDVLWRGFGMVSQSGLALRKDYSLYNAVERFPVEASESSLPRGCSCGDILRGKKTPSECPLFTRLCTPFYPVGPCMVSSEGACAACYQYEYSS